MTIIIMIWLRELLIKNGNEDAGNKEGERKSAAEVMAVVVAVFPTSKLCGRFFPTRRLCGFMAVQ